MRARSTRHVNFIYHGIYHYYRSQCNFQCGTRLTRFRSTLERTWIGICFFLSTFRTLSLHNLGCTIEVQRSSRKSEAACLLPSKSEFRVGCKMHSHNAKSLTAVHVISKIRSVCNRIHCSSGRFLNMHFKANYGNWLQSTFHISNLESVGAMHCTSEAQTCLQYEFHVRSWLRSSQINQTVGLV